MAFRIRWRYIAWPVAILGIGFGLYKAGEFVVNGFKGMMADSDARHIIVENDEKLRDTANKAIMVMDAGAKYQLTGPNTVEATEGNTIYRVQFALETVSILQKDLNNGQSATTLTFNQFSGQKYLAHAREEGCAIAAQVQTQLGDINIANNSPDWQAFVTETRANAAGFQKTYCPGNAP